MILDSKSAADLEAYMASPTLLQAFAEKLTKSPVRQLHLSLCLRVLSLELDEEANSFWLNAGAIEFFLKSGVLEPSRDLSNVRSFTFSLEIEHLPYSPQPKYTKIIEDLARTVEDNFAKHHKDLICGKTRRNSGLRLGAASIYSPGERTIDAWEHQH